MKELIEKLIGRLEELQKISKEQETYGRYTAYSNAIRIVNQLAEEYNNDFCEWKKKNSNEYVCNVHAEIHDSRVLDWCVCPYCGKKIKIAPFQPKGE